MITLCIVSYRYLKIDLFSESYAEDEEQEVPKVKTDLDKLKYEYSKDDIESFIELYKRMEKQESKKAAIIDRGLEIEENIHNMTVKYKSLLALNARLTRKFRERINLDKIKLARLVKTYSSMKANEAAPLLLKHNKRVIVRVLDVMKEKVAAKIYTEMLKLDKDRSVLLAELYTGFNTNYTKELMKKEISEKDLEDGVEKEEEKEEVKKEEPKVEKKEEEK
jgi:flagellar motility protein MotE (MotC chaperone)